MKLTLREIYNQYEALQKTVDLFEAKKDGWAAQIEGMDAEAIVFTGCGSSYYLSCAFRAIASTRIRKPVYALAAGDLWLNAARYQPMMKGALVICVTRSGRTSEAINAFKAVQALNCGAKFVSIICAEDTPLEALSEMTIRMPWAFDESVCQTRCVSNMYAMGAMLIGAMSGDASIHAGFAKMAALGEDYLKRIDGVAQEYAAKEWDHAVVLADGEIDGLAEEGALAFKEISQLNSNYYHLLDVRHGPMVKVCEQTLVVAAVKSPLDPYEAALIGDALAHKAHVICCTQMPVEIDGAVNLALGEEVGSVACGLGLVNFCQLVTYYKSKYVGCDPDQPDGLDAWIHIG